jgi:alpha-L-fucosidase
LLHRYRPQEVDFSIQNPGDAWFWHPNVEYDAALQLWNIYMLTVGRGSNLILNVPPNSSGLIPDNLVKETRALGSAIASLSPPHAIAMLNSTTTLSVGDAVVVRLPVGAAFDTVVSMEDLSGGQCVAR